MLLLQGEDKRKKRVPELIGAATLNCPLLLPRALVTGNQMTGEVKLVAKYNPQPFADDGQLMVNDFALALTLVADSDGSGRIPHL
jgi:hypothetical protein